MNVEELRTKIKKIKKIDKKNWIIGAAVLLAVITVLLVNFYTAFPTRKISEPFFENIPIPIATVDKSKIIFSKELIKDSQAVKNFYQTQDFSAIGMRVDFKTKEGKMRLKIKEKEILNKLVEDAIVKEIANQKGIVVTSDDSKKELAGKIADAKIEPVDFALNVRKLYDWSLEDFRREIVYPQIYMKKLQEYYKDNIEQEAPAFGKIKEAEAKIAQDNSNFDKIANEYSQGESAKNGGELGWFKKDQIVPEVADIAFNTEPGQRTGVVTSSLGFHIILVEAKRNIQNEDGIQIEEVKLKQIFTQNGGFIDWLVNKKKEKDVSVFMRDFIWNSETAQIEFRNQSLIKMEDHLRLKSEGDPSM